MELRRGTRRIGAFTLLELLAVIAILALLVGILLPALAGARNAASGAAEMGNAHQQMTAYQTYATERDGRVLVGYPQAPKAENEYLAEDQFGSPIGTPMSRRYPWRLLPSMGYSFDQMMRNAARVERLVKTDQAAAQYVVSVAPALGLNQTFVGGSSDSDGGGYAFNEQALSVWGRGWYVDRTSDVKRPASLLVFVSATSSLTDGDGEPLDGSYRVTPPYFADRIWSATPASTRQEISANGNVSLRFGGRAVGATFDGHAEYLGWDELQDMRRWAPTADRPDWTMPAPGR